MREDQMKCEQIKDQFINYLKGEISGLERKLIDDHVSECEHCRLELHHLQSAWTALEEIPELEPSSQLRERFYGMLDNEKSGKQGLRSLFQAVWPARPQSALSYTFVIILFGFVMGRFLITGGSTMSRDINQPQISQIQEDVSQLRDMVALTLLSQDSVQARLRGIDFARTNISNDPRVLTLLLNTFERDETRNVRLAALDVLGNYLDDPMVKERIYNNLLMETSPIVQLKIVELLLEAAGDGWQEQLDDLLKTGILDSTVTGFLQEVRADGDRDEDQGTIHEL